MLAQSVALAQPSVLDLKSDGLHLVIKYSDPLLRDALVYSAAGNGWDKIPVLEEAVLRDGSSVRLYFYGGANLLISRDWRGSESALYTSRENQKTELQTTSSSGSFARAILNELSLQAGGAILCARVLLD